MKLANELISKGHIAYPRQQKTVELEDVWLILNNPINNICTLKSRAFSEEYLKGELEWYLNGSLDVKQIANHSSFWTKLADTNGTVNSNYGFIALKEKWAGLSQFEWCVNQLAKDEDTRQAVINYNRPDHKYPGNKDFVCAMFQQFRSHLDDGRKVIESRVFIRSNDMIFGLTYDIPWFVFLQNKLVEELQEKHGKLFSIGRYYHYAASMHVYERHFEMLGKIAKEEI